MTLSILAFVVCVAILLAFVALVVLARAAAEERPPSALPGPSTEALAKLRPWIIRYIKRRIPDPVSADDIAQEVLLSIASECTEYRPIAAPDPLRRWAVGVARNRIRMHWRARAARRAFTGGAS
ncbi:MAG: sigma factor [Polyangiaceae bacterium]